MNARCTWLLLLAAPAAPGCDSGAEGLPQNPPQEVAKVTSGGFSSPTDAVASLDGSEFYFAAFTTDGDSPGTGAVFRTAATAGSSAELLTSAPLEMPTGLVLSCDGDTLYVGDAGADTGGLYALPSKGGALTELAATGIGSVRGLAMAPDCKTLMITGRTDAGVPALFSVAIDGGAAATVFADAPLVAPTGVHVDKQGTAWVMDNLAVGKDGAGVLFAIRKDGGAASEVASGLRMGTPGGVSLTAGGGTAVMPTRDDNGVAQLTSVSIATGEMTQIPTPDLIDPAGLRTARQAGVFAVVDSEGGAIYRAQ
jgi:DNA-binding beta-propeller fold protein YncE